MGKGHHLKVSDETCGGWCMAGIIIDSLFIIGDMGGMGCGPLAMLVWWVQGVVVLAVDQNLNLDDAIFVLVQQITTIGYGSHGPKTAGMKIWHALHSPLIWKRAEATKATLKLFLTRST